MSIWLQAFEVAIQVALSLTLLFFGSTSSFSIVLCTDRENGVQCDNWWLFKYCLLLTCCLLSFSQRLTDICFL